MLDLLLAVTTTQIIIYVAIGLLAILLVVILALVPIKTWFVALVSGAHVSMSRLIGMKMRRIPVAIIVDAYIMAKKAGISVEVVSLETHHLAGGDVRKVINAVIAAHSAKIDLSLEDAKAIDLAGRDVDQAVRQCVTPKVITTDLISAVAKDGVEFHVFQPAFQVTHIIAALVNAVVDMDGDAGSEGHSVVFRDDVVSRQIDTLTISVIVNGYFKSIASR